MGLAAGLAAPRPAQAEPAVWWITGVAAASVAAGVIYDTPQADKDRQYLRAGVGAFDIVDDENTAVEGRVSFMPDWNVYRFRPVVGAAATSDGGAILHASIGHDFVLPYEQFYVWFEIGPALYFEGDGKDLGSNAVLRSGFEVGYRTPRRLAAGRELPPHEPRQGLRQHQPGDRDDRPEPLGAVLAQGVIVWGRFRGAPLGGRRGLWRAAGGGRRLDRKRAGHAPVLARDRPCADITICRGDAVRRCRSSGRHAPIANPQSPALIANPESPAPSRRPRVAGPESPVAGGAGPQLTGWASMPLLCSSSCNSPLWNISRTMSQPPTNSPLT